MTSEPIKSSDRQANKQGDWLSQVRCQKPLVAQIFADINEQNIQLLSLAPLAASTSTIATNARYKNKCATSIPATMPFLTVRRARVSAHGRWKISRSRNERKCKSVTFFCTSNVTSRYLLKSRCGQASSRSRHDSRICERRTFSQGLSHSEVNFN